MEVSIQLRAGVVNKPNTAAKAPSNNAEVKAQATPNAHVEVELSEEIRAAETEALMREAKYKKCATPSKQGDFRSTPKKLLRTLLS